MLILKRHPTQYLIIAGQIRVSVERIQLDGRGRPEVRLRIGAPAAIKILRTELLSRGQDLGSVALLARPRSRLQPGRIGFRLALSRHAEQGVQIGNEVSLFVVRISEDRHWVWLAVTAPREIPVLRGELYEAEIDLVAGEVREVPKPTPGRGPADLCREDAEAAANETAVLPGVRACV